MAKTEDTLVKAPYRNTPFTDYQLEEFVKCADPDHGPEYFMSNYFHIQHPVKGKMLYYPYDYQKRLINTYHNYRFSISMMPRQTGKALDVNTPILTPTGFVKLQDISVGDIVFGQNGQQTQVVNITDEMIDHQCYEITFDNGDTIIADADHLWQLSCSNWRVDHKVLTTQDIIPYLDRSNRPYVILQNSIECNEKVLPIDPYLYGVWLGDGGKNDNRVTCHIDDLQNYIDQNIVDKVCNFSLKYPTIRVFNSRLTTKQLKQLNLYRNKHILPEYITASFAQRLRLVQGLMDTDGSLDKRNGRCEFYQKDQGITDQFRILLSTLGIKSRKSFKVIKGQIYYTTSFVTNLSVFNLPRKKQAQGKINHPKNTRLYINKIIPVESRPVRCLQVNNQDHLFLAGTSLIPTHNSTSAAGYLLWVAMFVPDSTILIAAHKYTGSQEIMQRIRYAYELCPDYIRAGATNYNRGSIDFENGSRIISTTTTENTGRGMSISLLYADEFAFVRPGIAKEFWTSISPTLATGGKAIITSTPNSDEDQFALLWKGANKREDAFGNQTSVGINGFKPFRSYWNEHPDRDEKWAAEQQAQLGEDRFRREMGCEFIINDETLIAPAKLIDLSGHEPLYRTGQVRWYQKPRADRTYVISLDPSLGTGGDPSAIQIFEANTTEQVGEWRHNRTPIPEQIRILADICRHINETVQSPENIYYSIENNTIGEAALISIAEYGEENIQGYFLSEPANGNGRRYRKGFNTTNKHKLSACNKLKSLIESGKMKIRSSSLISELKTFVAHGISYAAKPGETDDLVMATVLNIRMLQLLQTYNNDIDNQMRDHGDAIISPMPFISVMR
jgi:hypothetical protein